MIVKVMIGLAALLSTILVVAATKPKTFRIQRSTSIDAPPESVFVRKRQRKHTVDMLSPQPASKRGRCKGDPRVLCWATSPLQSENSQAAEPLIQGAVFITVFAPIHLGKMASTPCTNAYTTPTICG
jgi:hypothetical protein